MKTPTLLVHGAEDQCELVETTNAAARFFHGPYRRLLLADVGHFPQRENSQQTATAILNHLRRFPG